MNIHKRMPIIFSNMQRIALPFFPAVMLLASNTHDTIANRKDIPANAYMQILTIVVMISLALSDNSELIKSREMNTASRMNGIQRTKRIAFFVSGLFSFSMINTPSKSELWHVCFHLPMLQCFVWLILYSFAASNKAL